jgi:hypothetical protein
MCLWAKSLSKNLIMPTSGGIFCETMRMRTQPIVLFQLKNGGKNDEILNRCNQLGIHCTLVPFAAAVGAHVWYVYGTQRRKHKRRASFTSLGLALGTFPIESNVPEAIINAACYFSDEIPTLEAIATEVVEPLLHKYERMSQVLDVNTGYFCPALSPTEPKDLIRVIEIYGPDDKLLNQTVFDHLQDSFIERPLLPWWEILVIKTSEQVHPL